MSQPTPADTRRGRWCLVLAALLWSLSGFGTRLLQRPTMLHLEDPALTPVQIALFRALFAGLVLLPMVPFRSVSVRPIMFPMIICFAAMNATFISAVALGTSANAILLQNTAPFFVFGFSIFILREPADTKSLITIVLGLLGMAVIVGGDGKLLDGGSWDVTLMGIASGVTYAAVILCLRHLRDQPSAWLAMQNHLGSAICMGLAILILHGYPYWISWLTTPSVNQLLMLLVFGTVQMALPYFLFARGLRSVSPQEAGAITLLEPLLNPVWAYLISPETDTPTSATFLGGGLIIGALAYRYWPRRTPSDAVTSPALESPSEHP